MNDQALGCKTMGCFVGAIAVLTFFAYLLHSAQDMAEQAKKARTAGPQIGRMVDTENIGSPSHISPPGSEAADDTTADIINAARLPALLSAVHRYAADHTGMFPPMESPDALRKSLFPGYVTGAGMFQSPRGKRAYLPNPALSGKPLKSFAAPHEIIAFYEPLNPTGPEAGKRRAVLFLDGSQRGVTPSEWRLLQQKARLP